MRPDGKPDHDWQERYRALVTTPEAAVREIRAGQRVFLGTGCAQPEALVQALCARSQELADTEIVHLLTVGDAPYAQESLSHNFSVNSFFIAPNVRDTIQHGLGDYTPILLSDIPELFSSGRLPLDAALIQVSPPDEEGFCSLGVSVDIVKSAAENAQVVIAEVNPCMPRTLGNSFLHVFDLDWLVPVDRPLPEIPQPEQTPETLAIGEHVASLVEDGATIEMGIGRVPQAVLAALADKKDLGIHTEMLTDALIPLIESGAVNGARKTIDRGKVVASFCLGTRRLYDFIDNNPLFSFHPTEYVNDLFIIGQQERMVSINVALEVDVTGQVCADSLGTQFYSGIGGQPDFNRGAARSRGGKAIIALPSTARDGAVSRIVTRLSPGAGVVTTRGDVHYVVTEHGVAYLHGKSIQERVLALISIAHPDFREGLLKEAIDCRYVRPELAEIGGKIVVAPKELRTTAVLEDGIQINLRPVHPTDEPKVRELFYGLSTRSLYTRFMGGVRWVSHRQLQRFVYVDHRNVACIVATLPAADGDEIIASAGYYLDPKTNRAEVDFVVKDAWQGKGIGGHLFRHLTAIARRNGLSGFTAEVLFDNKPMQALLRNSGLKTTARLEDGVYHFELDFG